MPHPDDDRIEHSIHRRLCLVGAIVTIGVVPVVGVVTQLSALVSMACVAFGLGLLVMYLAARRFNVHRAAAARYAARGTTACGIDCRIPSRKGLLAKPFKVQAVAEALATIRTPTSPRSL